MIRFFLTACALACMSMLFAQGPDFKKMRKEVLEAQNARQKARAYVNLASVLPPPQNNLIPAYEDSVLLIDAGPDSVFSQNAVKFLAALQLFRQDKLPQAKTGLKAAADYLYTEDKDLYYQCANYLGVIYTRMNQPDSAYILYDNMLKELPADHRTQIIMAHANLGRTLRSLGDYASAIDHLNMAMDMDTTDLFTQINSYMIIASMYQEMEYYEKGIATLREVNLQNMPVGQVSAAYFNNLGNLYYEIKQYDSARYFLEQAIAMVDQNQYYHLGVRNRLTLASILSIQNGPEAAMPILRAAQATAQKSNNPPAQMDLYLHLAKAHLDLKQPDSALIYLRKIPDPRAPFLIGMELSAFQLWAEVYQQLGQTDSSQLYMASHLAWQDSIMHSGKMKFLSEARAKYQIALKERELAQEKSKSSLLSQTQLITLLILMALTAGTAILIVVLRKYRSKLDHTEAEKNHLSREIELSKSEILELKSKALLHLDEIVSIKSDGHYLEFYLTSKQKPEIDRNRIKEILQELPQTRFVQIHKSYIVNIDHIKVKYASKVLLTNGKELPVSRTFKDELNRAIDTRNQ